MITASHHFASRAFYPHQPFLVNISSHIESTHRFAHIFCVTAIESNSVDLFLIFLANSICSGCAMLYLVISVHAKAHFVVPKKWIYDYDGAKQVNNVLNKNQKHLIYTTNKAEAHLLNGQPDKKWAPNFRAPLVNAMHGLPIDMGSECVFHGYLVKSFSKWPRILFIC